MTNPAASRPISTAKAADLAGMTQAAFRGAMTRARGEGVDLRLPGPDARTPMWDEAELRKWLAARPGRGNWGKSPRG